ncbi:MAG: hypothetical protein IMX00_06225 [Limnochordales bacterium]|nr:hypothetical protein [Limnochordales bacterium]
MNFVDLLRFDLLRSMRTPLFLWVMVTYLVGSTAGLLLVWPGPLRLEDLAAPAEAGAELSSATWVSGRATFAWVVTIQLFFLGCAATILAAAPGWREEDISLQTFAAGAPQTPAAWVAIHSLATLGLLAILALAGLPISLAALGTRVLSASTSPAPPLPLPTLLPLLLWTTLAGAGYLTLAIAAGTAFGLRLDPIFRYPAAFVFAGIAGVLAAAAADTGMTYNPFAAVWTAVVYMVHPASRSVLVNQPGSFWPAATLSSLLAVGALTLVSRNVNSLRRALWAEEAADSGAGQGGLFHDL